jgi:hypothetical protein
MERFNKAAFTTLAACLLACPLVNFRAIAGDRLSICVTNKSGDVFTNLTVGKVLGDGMLLENSAGQFKVKFTELPAEVREKYQGLAAAAARRERSEAEANARFVARQQSLQAGQDRGRITVNARERGPASAGSTNRYLKIAIPGQGWSIGILDFGFGRLNGESNPGQFVCRGTAENGLNLSIYVETPPGSGTRAEDVCNYYWPKASRNPLIEPGSVKMEKLADFVKVTYVTAGMPNVNYYFAYQGKWVDVHISNLVNAKSASRMFAEFESRLAYGK